MKFMKSGRTAKITHCIEDNAATTLCGAAPGPAWILGGDSETICTRCQAAQEAIDSGEPLLEGEPEEVQFETDGQVADEDVDTIFLAPMVQQTAIEIVPQTLVGEILPPEESELEFMNRTLDEYRVNQVQPIIGFEVDNLAQVKAKTRAFVTLFERDPETIAEGCWSKFWSTARNRFIDRAIDGRQPMGKPNLRYFRSIVDGEEVLLEATGIRYILMF